MQTEDDNITPSTQEKEIVPYPKPDPVKRRMTLAERSRAKSLYFDYCPVSEIAGKLGFSERTIWRLVERPRTYGGMSWREERKHLQDRVDTSVLEGQIHILSEVGDGIVRMTRKAIENRLAGSGEASPEELQMLSSIYERLVKTTRLQSGESTANVAHAHKAAALSPEEVRKILLESDPMMRPALEASFEETK